MLEILNDSTDYQDNQSKVEVYERFIENYHTKSFDIAFASLVLHYIHDLESTICSISYLMKNGSKL